MDTSPEGISAGKRKKTGWLWLAMVPLAVFAAIADLRTFVASHERPPPGLDGGTTGESASMTVLLFQWRPRWLSCSRMERLVREVLAPFPSVELRSVNLDNPANRHYIAEFGIETETVVLLYDGSRFAILDECPPPGLDEAVFKSWLTGILADFAAAGEQAEGPSWSGLRNSMPTPGQRDSD